MNPRRKRVRLDLDEVVEILRDPRQLDAFFVDWRCRLCGLRAGALDRTAALDAAVDHLALDHHACGGDRRKTR